MKQDRIAIYSFVSTNTSFHTFRNSTQPISSPLLLTNKRDSPCISLTTLTFASSFSTFSSPPNRSLSPPNSSNNTQCPHPNA